MGNKRDKKRNRVVKNRSHKRPKKLSAEKGKELGKFLNNRKKEEQVQTNEPQ